MKTKVLDLFSVCGGMSFGFDQAGFSIELGIDNGSNALSTFKKNHKNSSIINENLLTLVSTQC